LNAAGQRFPLLEKVGALTRAGQTRTWPVWVANKMGATVAGRICAVRKSEEAIKLAQKRAQHEAMRSQYALQPATLEFAKYVVVFTTFPQESFSELEVLRSYRTRWQVELVFKRFKSIAALGHLPKHGDESAKAWLYGKLFVALLTERLVEYAETVSPGDTNWKRRRPRSRWREFAFAFNQVKRAIEPPLPLAGMFSHWTEISKTLAETERCRKPQLTQYYSPR